MPQVPDSILSIQTKTLEPDLRLLIMPKESSPGDFWPDVFVEHGLPWGRFLQSFIYHALVLTALWAASRLMALQPRAVAQRLFTHSDVVYYSPSEYLPPLDTRRSSPRPARKADPEYSAQPIISVPPEADNHSQTIVTPPNIQLQQDISVPNVVSLLEKMPGDPRMPIGPAPAVPASETFRLAPQMNRSAIIAPPPDVRSSVREMNQGPASPNEPVIAPPPAVVAETSRRLGDLNIGHSPVIAPAPQLSLAEQRALPGRISNTLGGRSTEVIAPPPSLNASRSRPGAGMVALSLRPAVGKPPDPAIGNRRGSFAATPEGHGGASGTPGTTAGNGKENGSGLGKKSHANLPEGLYVGKTSNATSPVSGDPAPKNPSSYSVNPNLIADIRPPRVSARSLHSETDSNLSQEERAVFGNRKFYSLSLNMPNLNSAGGSWIIRFAALRPDLDSASASSRAASSVETPGAPSAELSAPSAMRKVDPAYPLELMRQNVGGTVILYAVIHADGKVGNVRVLRSIDERLDQFASQAIAKWQFQPATKNGAPVDVEATFWIPFHPARAGSNF